MSRTINQLIELAKLDTASPDKITALSVALQAQQDREAKQALQKSFQALQAELPQIDHNDQIVRNGEVICTFCNYEKLHEIIQPSLTTHGFTVTRHTQYAGPNNGDTTVIVTHTDGASIQSSFPIIASDWSGMSEAQAIASGETFAARRALCAVINLVTRGADNNGEIPERQIHADVSDKPEHYDKRMKFLETASTKGQKHFVKAFRDCEQDVKDWAVRNEPKRLETIKRQAVTPIGAEVVAPF